MPSAQRLALDNVGVVQYWTTRIRDGARQTGASDGMCRLIWILLHTGVPYEERGPAVCQKSRRARTLRMIRTLRSLGYRVEALPKPA